MLTKLDKKFLLENFVTKGDLDNKFDAMLKPINVKLKKIKDALELAIDTFDRQIIYHHKRLVNLEKKTGLDEQPYSPSAN